MRWTFVRGSGKQAVRTQTQDTLQKQNSVARMADNVNGCAKYRFQKQEERSML